MLELKLDLGKKSLFVANIYNAPLGYKRAGRSIDILMTVPEIWQKQLLIIRDINLHHPNWDNRTIHPTSQPPKFAEWILDYNGVKQLEPRAITHTREGILDLIISSSSIAEQITKCYVKLRLYVTGDYESILTQLK